jgi:hypothetical protein
MTAIVVNCNRCEDPLNALLYGMREGRYASQVSASVVASNVTTSSAFVAAREFRQVGNVRPLIKKRYLHIVLSIYGKWRQRHRRRWNFLVRTVLQDVGLEPSKFPFTANRHDDTENEHVHIVVSRVALDGAVWHGRWELHRLQRAAENVARQLGIDAGPENFAEHHVVIKANRVLKRLGKPVLSGKRIIEIVQTCLEQAPDLVSLIEMVNRRGVSLRKKTNDDGTDKGFVVDVDGLRHGIALSTLTRGAYSFSNVMKTLKDRGFGYRSQGEFVGEIEPDYILQGEASRWLIDQRKHWVEANLSELLDAECEAGQDLDQDSEAAATLAGSMYDESWRQIDYRADDPGGDSDADNDESEDRETDRARSFGGNPGREIGDDPSESVEPLSGPGDSDAGIRGLGEPDAEDGESNGGTGGTDSGKKRAPYGDESPSTDEIDDDEIHDRPRG